MHAVRQASAAVVSLAAVETNLAVIGVGLHVQPELVTSNNLEQFSSI